MRTLSQQVVDLLIAWRIPLLLVAAIAAAASFFPAGRLEFDRSIENMFAPDDPVIEVYRKLKRTFGGNELVLAVYVDEDLLDPERGGIRRLAEVSEALRAVHGVYAVVSLDQPMGQSVVDPERGLSRRIRELFEGYTHSADGKVAAVVCVLTPESETEVPRREVIDQIRRIVGGLPEPLHSGMIAGEPVMVADGFRYVEADGARLGWTTMLLLAVTIIVCFRSLRWVIIPLAVVELALVLTKATLVWSRLELSMVSSMLTAIVTVVSIATVVHVIVRFREARLGGLAPREALSRAGGLLAVPIFWACSTTAVGFASLTVARVGPVQDFGRMMALGSLMVLVSVALLLPGLALLGRFDTDPKRAWGERLLDRQLHGLVDAIRRRPRTLASITLVLVVGASAGVFRLEVESDFTKNFRAASPIVRSYEFVETNLGGAGVWDVVLPAPEHLHWDYLARVCRLEDRLRKEVTVRGPAGRPVAGLTKVLSLADGVGAVSPFDLESLPTGLRGSIVLGVALRLFSRRMPALAEALYGEDPEQPDRHFFRVMLRSSERQSSAQKQAIIEQVERISREEFPPTNDPPGAQVTGFFVLLTNLIRSVMRDQWMAFGVASLGIGLMMLTAFRSPLLALLALIPNALPILVVTGLMGWLGLKINMGAAMIAAVSMGLSIDSSIHYLTAFRRARREGNTLDEALDKVHQSVGRAMVFSILALIVGFSALCTSQFVPTIYFGALVSLSMLGGLAGNLVVLPLLLKMTMRD